MAAGRLWTLTSLNGQTVTAARPPTLQFEQGRLAVFGGVNQLTGSYGLIDGKVVLSDLVSTKRAGVPAAAEREQAFAKALAAAEDYRVQGDELSLLRNGEVIAVFSSR